MIKRVFFIRHGDAEYGLITRDYDRMLTDEGADKLRKNFALFKEEVKISKNALIISSPLVRAGQTATILAKSLGLDEEAIVYKEFVAHGNPFSIIGELELAKGYEDIYIVGHYPLIGEFVEELTDKYVDFKKGMLVGLEHLSTDQEGQYKIGLVVYDEKLLIID